jgi:hypothetical protein
MKILTLDIGGANVKKLVLEDESLDSKIFYFPIWKKKGKLKKFIQKIREKADFVGITMTAELSDAFRTMQEGVKFIVSVCEDVFEHPFYLSFDRRLVSKDEIKNHLDLAGANWAASVYFAEEKFEEGILMDIGSTTTDILPFRRGEALCRKTDLERLECSQLIYTGYLRTPVSAITRRLPYKGKLIRISSENFAITADVYKVLGMLEDYSCETPDKRGKGKHECMQRLARVLCSDLGSLGEENILKICNHIFGKQVEMISQGLMHISKVHSLDKVYGCGIGKDLGKEACSLAGLEFHDLSAMIKAWDNLPCLGLAWMIQKQFQ